MGAGQVQRQVQPGAEERRLAGLGGGGAGSALQRVRPLSWSWGTGEVVVPKPGASERSQTEL